MNDTTTSKQSSSVAVSRGKMLALVAVYAAPLLAAWLWLGYVRDNEGAGLSVNGELIHPAMPIKPFNLVDSAGQSWEVANLQQKWNLMYFAGGKCTEICEKNLYKMRQVRLATGRRMDRVQRVLVTPHVQEMTDKLAQANEGLAVVGGSGEQIQLLRQQVIDAQKSMTGCESCIYVVDPFGNLMMRFSPDLDPRKMVKDLKHLLKVSRIG